MNTSSHISEKYKQIVPPHEKYCMPGPNEIKFISSNQTLSLVLGSCVSTVFVGKKDNYILAANHILLAKPHAESIAATKGAQEQVDEIISVFQDAYGIPLKDLYCLYVVGGGKKLSGISFNVHIKNLTETQAVLDQYKLPSLFNDTGSYFFSTYSISKKSLSIFIENKNTNTHISFIIDLDELFRQDPRQHSFLPASALDPENKGFNSFNKQEIIVFVTGARNRHPGF
ncbi:MAG: hypothetical protein GY754_04715 [bacterium]|nr:hypothetical protein [bacterium]